MRSDRLIFGKRLQVTFSTNNNLASSVLSHLISLFDSETIVSILMKTIALVMRIAKLHLNVSQNFRSCRVSVRGILIAPKCPSYTLWSLPSSATLPLHQQQQQEKLIYTFTT